MTRLELAALMLADAQWNLTGKRYRSAVSRAYYACYHAARACLEQQGIILLGRNPHSGTSNLFGLHLVLPGFFPRWMGRVLNDLYRARVDADYKAEAEITENLAQNLVARAESFLKEVREKWDRL